MFGAALRGVAGQLATRVAASSLAGKQALGRMIPELLETNSKALADRVINLVRSEKGRFISGLVAYGLVDVGAEGVLNLLMDAAKGDTDATKALEEVHEQIQQYREAAGVNVNSHGDGKVVNVTAEDTNLAVGAYLRLAATFDTCVAALGSPARFLALMEWFNADEDLRRIVLSRKGISND